jgi:predicted transcriptional regulator of viral defense system
LSAARPKAEPFDALTFFKMHGVFRLEDFIAAHVSTGRSSETSRSLLKYHVKQGTLINLRRGLYKLAEHTADPYVLMNKLAPDAVLAYEGAAAFLRLSHLENSLTFLSSQRIGHFIDNEIVFRSIAAKDPRNEAQRLKVSWGRDEIHVTTRERTLVDLLDRFDLGPGPEQLWNIFLDAGPLNDDGLIERAKALESQTTAARLGFFLENLGPAYERATRKLEPLAPKSPLYFDRANRKDRQHSLIDRWNLVVEHDFLLGVERKKRFPRRTPWYHDEE